MIEADATGSPVLRAMVLLPSASAQQPSNRFLEAVIPVPSKLAADSEAVQSVYREYRELELATANASLCDYADPNLLLALAAAFFGGVYSGASIYCAADDSGRRDAGGCRR